jgi:hypothetical protein
VTASHPQFGIVSGASAPLRVTQADSLKISGPVGPVDAPVHKLMVVETGASPPPSARRVSLNDHGYFGMTPIAGVG